MEYSGKKLNAKYIVGSVYSPLTDILALSRYTNEVGINVKDSSCTNI